MEVSAGADTMEADQEKRFDAEQDNQVEDEAGTVKPTNNRSSLF